MRLEKVERELMEEKKKSFETKLNEKIHDHEIYKVLIQNKKNEIDNLIIKKNVKKKDLNVILPKQN